jgi:CheY-like chemotaxis protein
MEKSTQNKRKKRQKDDIMLLDWRLGDMQSRHSSKEGNTDRGAKRLKIVMINAYDLPEEMVEELKQSGYIVDIVKKAVSVKNSLIEKIESF